MKTEHKTTLWKIDDYVMSGEKYLVRNIENKNDALCVTNSKENAEFIIKACNSHDALVEALEACKDRITRLEGNWENAGILAEKVDEALKQAE